ncbi:AMP-binding protein [Planomonospora parontospora]|uniref:AMP-binding protein n=1 Tax=Planomonospora parontospora TaxID=58119 RepID=UPI001671195E|nr:AMP-binding protein [Planomonospora parontospora]GGL15031.1 3-[(3aS,4S,7aS)-7a-methyl-1,5-dioxo-octahydro-1H-inden-4-yl]propanoyl:CoA ligase [Planomonospora parontospora subsp. antibiotica]GII15902.1 3-[(3aS,4S,7aS)-7a-methyl-1,5-dioxo-octahydro-1H- inden-4-yl]propanoyl:CoA ligase [Planomonospora parontospora subsp. antibiotica]
MSENGALTIPGVLDRAARDFPETEAVVDGPVRVTYRELRDRVRGAVRAFAASGAGRGDRIAVWAPNGLEWIVAALGAVSAGAVLVPVNTRYKGEEARWVLARSRARTLFVEDGFLGNDYLAMLGAGADAVDGDGAGTGLGIRAEGGGGEGTGGGGRPVPGLPDLAAVVAFDREARPGTTNWEAFLAGGASVPEETARARSASVAAGDVADVLFTSGTTGRPKGVMCTHGQNVRTYEAWCGRTGLSPGDRYLIVNPFFHCFGYKAGVLACLLRGATMVLQPVFEPGETMRLIETERITVLPGPPTIYTTMLDAPERPRYDLSSLRLAVTGAATVPVALVTRLRAELFPQVVTAYGLTESCGTVTSCSLDDDDATVAGTSGRPIEGVQVAVADGAGRPVPAGEDGEILVRGHNVMLGYLDDPGATAEAVRDGWLVTGDRGRLDGRGNLTITGRSKDMFTVGGFNVYPAEVEQVLARHGAVAEAAVVGVPDARLGEVGRAYVVLRPGAAVTPEALVAHCRAALANFKVPREVLVVDGLPRNAAGKVHKAALPGGPAES